MNVKVTRHGNNQYTIGAKVVTASLINDKLMVRVGGGYVTIDDYMTFYGPQELLKLYREEMDKDKNMILASGVLWRYFEEDLPNSKKESEDMGSGEESTDSGNQTFEITKLKDKLKQDGINRLKNIHKNIEIGESSLPHFYEGKNTVVGIAYARQAIKKNVNVMVIESPQTRKVSKKLSA